MHAQRWTTVVLVVLGCAVAVLAVTVLFGGFRSAGTPDDGVATGPSSAQRAPSGDVPPTRPAAPGEADLLPIVDGTGATTDVSTTDQLEQAVTAAQPGDTIRMAAGTYAPLVITTSGTAAAPVTLTGPKGAVITGTMKGYTLHLAGASFWQLVGFSVEGGGKGVMLDNAQHNILDSMTIGRTDDEGVHLRAASSDNAIQRSTVHDTGRKLPKYGEGVYIGSAKSNWASVSGGKPDLSMRNRVVANTFRVIAAENVDVKEETSGSLISGNHFDGSAISGENSADSIIDMKGFASKVIDNVTTGESPELKNIIETHVITKPATSGCGNVIEGNTVQGFEPRGVLTAVDEKCS